MPIYFLRSLYLLIKPTSVITNRPVQFTIYPSSTHTEHFMSDKQTNPTIRDYSPSNISQLLASLAGYDLGLLPLYADNLIQHELKKLVRVGSSVLIPSFFGFFTSYYLLGKYIANPVLLCFSALAFALLLLVVDSIIVTTLSKTKSFGWFIRIAMSVCIGIVVSEPALLVLYEKTINARIEAELAVERSREETTLHTGLTDGKRDLLATEQQLSAAIAQLANYSDQRIARLRVQELEERKQQQLSTLNERKATRLEQEQARLEALEQDRQAQSDAIEQKMLAMNTEESGGGVSGKAGRGSFWLKLKGELAVLKTQAAEFDKQIAEVNSHITAIQADRTEEEQVSAQFKTLPAIKPDLTEDERVEKTRWDKEVQGLTARKAVYDELVQSLETRLTGLNAKYDLSTRDDSLTQIRVLYQIAVENPVLLVKVLALFLLILFIDTVPMLVKLTVQTGYEDYVRQESQKLFAESQVKRLVYDQECINAASQKLDKLSSYAHHLTQTLDATQAQGKRYPHEQVLHDEALLSMRLLARQLAQREPLTASISLPHWWSVIKARLMAIRRR